jgi:hypothetical protein
MPRYQPGGKRTTALSVVIGPNPRCPVVREENEIKHQTRQPLPQVG